MAKHHVDVESLRATLTGLRLPMGLVIDRVDLEGSHLHMQHKPFEARMPVPGTIRVSIGEANLAAFLETEAPAGLKDFTVRADAGRLVVQASKRVLIADVPATAYCRLQIRDRRTLHVVLDSVEVAGGANITNLVQSQLDAINPVVDAEDLPLTVELDEVEITGGQVLLRGRVAP